MIGRFSKLGVYHELLQSREFYRIFLAGILALASYLWDRGGSGVSTVGEALALVSVGINGVPIIWSAVTGIVQRKVNVDELVSLAIAASLWQGEFLTAAIVSLVMVLGALIEQATADSARKAIQSLITIAPETANIFIDGEILSVAVNTVKVGDVVLVKPGERIPVDAIIKTGITAVDESTMTGEPLPNEKKSGDPVYAGTLNQNGLITVEAVKVGADTTLGKVIKLVSEAEAHKPGSVKLMDRYALWFTPMILFFSGVTWWLTGDISRAVTVLIVGCPCALILAAPTAIVATIGRAAKSGILVKGGLFLEEAGRADVVLFDKTGTLTEGRPSVDEIVSVKGVNNKEVLTYAASVEQHSTHPLARAVLKAAHYARVAVCCAEDMFTEIGIGVRARIDGKLIEVGSAYIGGGSMHVPIELRSHLDRFKGNGATPLMVYREQHPLGVISVVDQVRSSGKKTVERLKALGIKNIGILSGDHEKSVRLVADAVGVTDAWSGLNPPEKLQIIKEYQESGRVVMFVGDGINDAPALASANVSIAMGGAGTDVALETADIALMHDDISKIPFLIRLSRRMMYIIKWNIAFGLVFNIAAVIAGGGGFLSPVMGAVVHNIGSVLVVLSSASMAFVPDRQ